MVVFQSFVNRHSRHILRNLSCLSILGTRLGQSVESALIALAAIFLLIARMLKIFNKKYCILTRRDKKESYLIVATKQCLGMLEM